MTMMHKSLIFFSYMMPLILFDRIEAANAFSPQGFGYKRGYRSHSSNENEGSSYSSTSSSSSSKDRTNTSFVLKLSPRTNNSNNNSHRSGSNRSGFGGGNKRTGSSANASARKTPFVNRYKQKDTQEYLGVSLDPMQNEGWGLLPTNNSSNSKSTQTKDVDPAEVDSTSSSNPSIRQGLTYFLQITCGRFIDKLVTPDQDQQLVTLVDINWLKTHEEVLHDRVANLKEAIEEWDEYRMPLLVDKRTGSILDGHHRYHVGRQLGLKRLPVVLVDYLADDTIDVDVWPECGIDCLSKEDVIQMSLSDKVYPPKTSKHGFVADMEPINIPLSHLE